MYASRRNKKLVQFTEIRAVATEGGEKKNHEKINTCTFIIFADRPSIIMVPTSNVS